MDVVGGASLTGAVTVSCMRQQSECPYKVFCNNARGNVYPTINDLAVPIPWSFLSPTVPPWMAWDVPAPHVQVSDTLAVTSGASAGSVASVTVTTPSFPGLAVVADSPAGTTGASSLLQLQKGATDVFKVGRRRLGLPCG
jgi:hypothetical protein